jgi:hypothetical protein
MTGTAGMVRRAICVTAVIALFGWVAAASAAANAPAWRLTGFVLPKNLAPGEAGQIELGVEDIGDAATDGEPVTVIDHLPEGVTATAAGALAREEDELEIPGPWGECAGVGTSTVTCTYEGGTIEPVAYFSAGPLTEGQPPGIGIDVSVSPSARVGTATNTAALSGGGAASASIAAIPVTISSTRAPFGLAEIHQWSTNVNGTPDTQAGSHPYETTTSFELNSNGIEGELSGELRDFHLTLPPGFAGDPTATPKCSREEFDGHIGTTNPDCPSDTQIGVAVLRLGPPNFIARVAVYNLVPPAGVPAQFGFAFEEDVGFIDGNVASGGSYAATVDAHDISQTPAVFGASITLWGDPGDPSHDKQRFAPGLDEPAGSKGESIPFGAVAKPFLTLPTSCGQTQALSASVDSWEEPQAPALHEQLSFDSEDMQERPVSLAGCERLSFNPSLSARPDSSAAETPTGLEVDLRVPQNEDPEGLATSDLKAATVQLPAGVTVNPSAANGLGACPLEGLEGISLGSSGPAGCPSSSKIATVQVTTPLLERPLEGSVFLAQQGNLVGNGSNPFGSLLAIYLVAEGEGVVVKLPGRIELDQATGQLTTRFEEDPVTSASTGSAQFLPQLPFSELKMSFFDGARAALITPSSCGSFSTASLLLPWSGEPAAQPSSAFTIGSGCSSGFAPSFAAGTTNTQAGGFASFSVTFSRKDGEQRFAGAQVTTPPGLLGVIRDVARCPEPQAGEGACGAESLIGEATVATGAGENPFWVKGGKVYLTGPYKGAPFGLSIVVPTSAGPFTLRGNAGVGREVVRAAVSVDPHTAQITVTSDPLPTMLEGVPLDVKTVNVTVNRPSFMINPTNCSPLGVAATLASTAGTTVGVSSPFEAANCAVLAFKPSLSSSTQAKTSKTDGASLSVKIGYASGQANLAKLKTDLPIQLPSRLTTLQKSCAQGVFAANPAACPAYSFVGSVKAVTPLLAAPLTGPAILVNHGGAQLPNLVFVLQGEGITIIVEGVTHVVKGITTEAFESLPDAPISSFQAVFPEGPHSVLAANGNLCANQSKLKMPVAFTAQNGATLKQTVDIAVTGCPRKAKTAAHKSRADKKR